MSVDSRFLVYGFSPFLPFPGVIHQSSNRVTTESYGVGTIEGLYDECRLTGSQVSV